MGSRGLSPLLRHKGISPFIWGVSLWQALFVSQKWIPFQPQPCLRGNHPMSRPLFGTRPFSAPIWLGSSSDVKWLWLKKAGQPKMGCPGKWKHGPKPAVCPSCLIWSHSQNCIAPSNSEKRTPAGTCNTCSPDTVLQRMGGTGDQYLSDLGASCQPKVAPDVDTAYELQGFSLLLSSKSYGFRGRKLVES